MKGAALLGKQPFKQHFPRLNHAAYRLLSSVDGRP
jgi:hypothetical protein